MAPTPDGHRRWRPRVVRQPTDYCANGAPIVQTTVVWPADLTNPTDPAQLHQMKCGDNVNGTVIPNPGLLPDAIGGVVWKTWTHGDVRFEGDLTHPLISKLGPHGGLVNLGEYNPCTSITCFGSRASEHALGRTVPPAPRPDLHPLRRTVGRHQHHAGRVRRRAAAWPGVPGLSRQRVHGLVQPGRE